MPRSPNFAYQDPTGNIIQSLGRALFGDPAARAAQAKAQSEAALREAQTGEAVAHGGLYSSQSADQTQRTGGALSTSQLIASFARPQPAAPAPAQAAPSDTLAPLPEAPAPQAAHAFNPAEFQGRIAQVMAAMALAQSGKVDPGTVGSLSAMFGDDEYARRGMVAQGHTPGKEFAITPDRADVIRSDEAGNSLAQALGVAGVNHSTDIPVANIRASASRDVAVTNNRDDVPVARIAAQGKVDAAGAKRTMGFGAVSSVLPNAVETSGERSPEHNRKVGGVSNSRHLTGDGIEAYDTEVMPGVSFEEAKSRMRTRYGSRLVEARDETGRTGPNGKALGGWHFAIAQEAGGKATAENAPRAVGLAALNTLKTEIDKGIAAKRLGVDPGAHQMIRERAVAEYQKSGNPVAAANAAIEWARQRNREGGAARMAGADGERSRALDAIAKGAPRDAVAARYKQNTGQTL